VEKEKIFWGQNENIKKSEDPSVKKVLKNYSQNLIALSPGVCLLLYFNTFICFA